MALLTVSKIKQTTTQLLNDLVFMRTLIFNPIAVLVLIALMLITSFSTLANETWKGTFKLSRGDQKAEATFDFENQAGMLQLPDLIPIPLQLTKVSRKQDSVFFTVGFRSGPALCKAKITGDTMKGIMSSRAGDTPFHMEKAEATPSIFGRPKPNADLPVEITTHTGSELERGIKIRLEKLLGQYDLEKYLYTKEIKIQSGTIPHSHPVLTLNTKYENNIHLLSTFLHEQMHWYTLSKEYDNKKLAEALFTKYPKVPGPLPEGAGDERSTYLHILVCYLEYHTLEQVIGTEKAKAHMEYMGTQHYKWVFQTVVRDYEELKEVVGSAGLHFN